MNFSLSLSTLAALCIKYAVLLTSLPGGVDPVRFLWALAGKESSYAANAVPRHEQAYCYGGRYCDPGKSKLYGCLWHCSYGPWQVMAANFPPGFSPADMMNNMNIVARSTIFALDQLIKRRSPQTLAQLAMTWNSGEFDENAESDKYAIDVQALYSNPALAMPTLTPA